MKTNDVTDVKEVMKKQFENVPKRKDAEKKMQMMQMIGLIRLMLIKIWNCIVGINFYGLILGHHEFIFS